MRRQRFLTLEQQGTANGVATEHAIGVFYSAGKNGRPAMASQRREARALPLVSRSGTASSRRRELEPMMKFGPRLRLDRSAGIAMRRCFPQKNPGGTIADKRRGTADAKACTHRQGNHRRA
jgi:hypothetical protein